MKLLKFQKDYNVYGKEEDLIQYYGEDVMESEYEDFDEVEKIGRTPLIIINKKVYYEIDVVDDIGEVRPMTRAEVIKYRDEYELDFDYEDIEEIDKVIEKL